MYAYGVCKGASELYAKYAEPSIRKFSEPGSPVFVLEGQKSMFEAYNTILDSVSQTDCEGVILLHDDVELQSDPVPAIKHTFKEHPDVGLIGTAGGSATRSLAWWREHESRRGRIRDYKKLHDHGAERAIVHSADDVILCASRWVVENVRFPRKRYVGFEGLGVVLSSYVRLHGREVMIQDLDVFHHNDNVGFNGLRWWRRNELRWVYDFFDLPPHERALNRIADVGVPMLDLRIAMYRRLSRMGVDLLPKDSQEESGDPVVDGLVLKWYRNNSRLASRYADWVATA